MTPTSRAQSKRDGVLPIILSAGQSSRMGRIKALMEVRGQVAIVRVIDLCRNLGLAKPTCVIGHHEDAIRECVASQEVTIVVNPDPDRGQFSSLLEGLSQWSDGYGAFLLFPVDRAFVQEEDVDALLRAYEKDDDSHDVYIPSYDQRRGHPVLIRETLVAPMRALDPTRSARDVLLAPATRIGYVEGVSEFVLSNLDRPEDYEYWTRRAGSWE